MMKAAGNIEQVHRELPVSAFFACSEIDRQRLNDIGLGDRPVYSLHNTLDVHDAVGKVARSPISPLLAQLSGPIVLFAGVLNYPPNQNAAMALVDEIFPLVQQRVAGTSLVLVGRSPGNALVAAARGSPDVFLTGEVVDTRPYFEMADVLCVPLQQGGGTRFKILEAFKYGVPVISSAKGAEGLIARHRQSMLLAETAEEHAAAIVDVLTDDALRQKLIRAGSRDLLEHYSHDVAAAQVDVILARHFGAGRT